MENNKEQFERSQQGTGSAENRGNERNEQTNNLTNLSSDEKQNIANEIGEDQGSISSLKDLGQLSGRDDKSGGNSDGMSDENTGERTER
jgi:hypothetical protein